MYKLIVVWMSLALVFLLCGCAEETLVKKQGVVVDVDYEQEVGFTYSDISTFIYFDDGSVFDVRSVRGNKRPFDGIRLGVDAIFWFNEYKYDNEVYYSLERVDYFEL